MFNRLFLHRPGTLHDFRSHEIADQLTLLDAELFYKIEVTHTDAVLLDIVMEKKSFEICERKK